MHGHLILDTGEQLKETVRLEHEILLPTYNFIPKKGDKIKFKFNHYFYEGLLVGIGYSDQLYVEVGTYTYDIRKNHVIAINDVILETLNGAKKNVS